MSTITITVEQLVLIEPDLTREDVTRAVAGFLADDSGATLDVYRFMFRHPDCSDWSVDQPAR